MPKIGIVTVTFNSGKVWEGFINSVLGQTHHNWILFVVDNDSKDDTIEKVLLCKDTRIRLIENKINYGVAKGNNQGIEGAILEDCDYILLLNNDTEFDKYMFSTLLDEMQNYKADMVTPKILYFEPNNKIWCAGGDFCKLHKMIPLHIGINEIDEGQYDITRFCTYTPTCCLLISKQTFIDTGLMDEKYFVYIDDVDWMYRAQKEGKKLLYTAKTKLYHKVSSLTGGDKSKFSIFMCNRNMVYYLIKNTKNKFYSFFLLSEYFLRTIYRTFRQLIKNEISVKDLGTIIKACFKGVRM